MDLASIWRRPTRSATNGRRARLEVRALEDRTVPTLAVPSYIAVGTGPGIDATVNVFNASGTFLTSFKPYPLQGGGFFQGGVETSVADINGDGVGDVITGAGPGGGPHVKAFNGVDILAGSTNPGVLRSFFAYAAAFPGGVHVAGGDINGDGIMDIVTGAGPGGGPHVLGYSGGDVNAQLLNFFPYDINFTGGVNVACGDIGGDQNTDEIVTGTGPGGAPLVRVFDFNRNPTPSIAFTRLAEFYAYDSLAPVGVTVSTGYYTNNRDAQGFLYADIATGAAQFGGPHTKVYRLLDAINDSLGNPNWQYFEATGFFAYDPLFSGGVRVGAVRNGTLDDLMTGAGITGGPHLRIFNQTSIGDLTTYTITERFGFFAFPVSFSGGIFPS